MTNPVAAMVIRGKVITDNLIEVGGRGGDLVFETPDTHQYIDQITMGNPARLADLYALSMDDILDYIEALGEKLDLATNTHLQQACQLSFATAPTTPPMVIASYMGMKSSCTRTAAREVAEKTCGIDYLEGWVPDTLADGRDVEIRCFGSRALHIVAGNSPSLSLLTILRNMLLRSDAVIKAPSNDPFTAVAIARTMIDMAPDHPLTKHLTVAYWRGGDEALEKKLYQPHNFEKIVAWGGYASIKHVTRYIQPGLELISLDPKRSASILGPETFESEENMQEAAQRLAMDIGGMNQAACVNARVVYALSGTDDNGLEKLNCFGEYVYAAFASLPNTMSTKPKSMSTELKAHLNALRLDDDWFKMFGGEDDEGAIIVSQLPDPVPFAAMLNDRVGNLVPVDTLEEVFDAVDSYTQTVGVYPESLKEEIKDVLPLYGAQRIVSLGYALAVPTSMPQDSIEPMRRMGKWIVNEICKPDVVPPLWELPSIDMQAY
jgi:Acyl-CoA reductase (LuxC)